MVQPVDFGEVAKDYAQWRNDVPEAIFDQLEERGVHVFNKQVADLGAGSGTFSRALSQRGAVVTGVEPSPALVQEARKIKVERGTRIRYVVATAEDTGLPDRSFDVVTTLRAWHWFDSRRATSEVRRILKPGGYFVVMDSAIRTPGSAVATETMALLRKYLPDGQIQPAGSKASAKELIHGFPKLWFSEWEEAGFTLIDAWQFEYEVRFSPEAWRGRIRSLSIFATLHAESRAACDAELAAMLSDKYADSILDVRHVFRTALLQKK